MSDEIIEKLRLEKIESEKRRKEEEKAAKEREMQLLKMN